MVQAEANLQVRVPQQPMETQSIDASPEGRHVIQELYSKCREENKENVGELYNGFTPEGYDEWATAVNFTEPYYIIDQCTKSVEEGGMGVSREAVVLDIGSCTGIIGQKL